MTRTDKQEYGIHEGARIYEKDIHDLRATYKCLSCGVVWKAPTTVRGKLGGGWTGFLEATVRRHSSDCLNRTPEQRAKSNGRWKRQRDKKPNLHTLVIFP